MELLFKMEKKANEKFKLVVSIFLCRLCRATVFVFSSFIWITNIGIISFVNIQSNLRTKHSICKTKNLLL